jgi:hypothetical protein
MVGLPDQFINAPFSVRELGLHYHILFLLFGAQRLSPAETRKKDAVLEMARRTDILRRSI